VADRRGFFKELLRGAVDVAQELSSAMQAGSEPEPWRPPPTRPARPAVGCVDVEALHALCAEVGLEHRAADVERMARVSLRLTPRPRAHGELGPSRLGGSPDLPPGFAWPSRDGRPLAFLGQLDLAEVATAAAETPLPRAGLLLFFYDLADRPSGLAPAQRGSCRVVLVRETAEPAADERQAHLRALPIEVSRELMLPGAWSFHSEELELSSAEMDAWDELNTRLARAQGVEPDETSVDPIALHRLLGYQDEIGREIEVDCQLASAGLDADDAEVYYEARDEHEAEARKWRLLLQLSADDALGTPADGSFERLFVCIRERDLQEATFDEVWAILR
jgi:uncharacterized protein YwqG